MYVEFYNFNVENEMTKDYNMFSDPMNAKKKLNNIVFKEIFDK